MKNLISLATPGFGVLGCSTSPAKPVFGLTPATNEIPLHSGFHRCQRYRWHSPGYERSVSCDEESCTIQYFSVGDGGSMHISRLSRAQGCLLGQLAGDALGSLVEFQTLDAIRYRYPGGIREMADGGPWNSLAGQPTDDSEMALLLARMLIKKRGYEPKTALAEYKFWLSSKPFDCGRTISASLQDNPNPSSQANGALMRISPLGIFGARHELNQTAE